jgi:hypothetical protein
VTPFVVVKSGDVVSDFRAQFETLMASSVALAA